MTSARVAFPQPLTEFPAALVEFVRTEPESVAPSRAAAALQSAADSVSDFGEDVWGTVTRAADVFRSVDLDGDGVPDEARALTVVKGAGSAVMGTGSAVKGAAVDTGSVRGMADRDETSSRPPRWHAALVAEDLPPSDGPVAALVKADGRTWAWIPDSGSLRPLPRIGSPSDAVSSFAEAGGKAVLLEAEALRPDDASPMLERRYCEGIYRLDPRDLTTTRLPFEPRGGWDWRHEFATSPDGRMIVVAERWRPDEFYAVARQFAPDQFLDRLRATATLPVHVALHLVDTAAGTSRSVLTIRTSMPRSSDDRPVQWAPDGSLIAVSLMSEVPGVPTTLVLEPTTGDIRHEIAGTQLVGSLSWHHDSDRLLLERQGRIVEHRLSHGDEHPLPPLPGAGSSTRRPTPPGAGRHRVLGYADEERLFSVTHRGSVMTLCRIRRGSAEVEPLARWAGSTDMYPYLTSMPWDFWS
ncbi:hypothetical protein [Cellulomonas sp. PS-H5]|uniref:hypothetical protein n=1 Tax=Cellulomonas sp. PS-H5 TaxID=2820400 RepID=UPI001C5009C2|nr:hypothetical protein [Cellulomonas sp. PS-H5]MBW0252487.1 hypothetical protein [Cellulomonas sp. PS-H5]